MSSSESQAQLTASGYSNLSMNGFNILVADSAFTQNMQLTQDALNLLDAKLLEITQLCISQEILDSLQAVSIFVDWNTTSGSAQYHPSLAWLLANGYIPEKEKCVEISNITNFYDWTLLNQPFLVLHELAHSYHHRVFNYMSADVTNAFNNAVSSSLYLNVQYHQGNGVYSTQPTAYALNNAEEYFSEITEAYFGLNDYFPFDNTDLQGYDPMGYQALQNMWTACLTDVDENKSKIEISIFPNPSNGRISFAMIESMGEKFRLDIYNSLGQEVFSSGFIKGKEIITADLSSHSRGLYFAKISSNNESCIRKIVLN